MCRDTAWRKILWLLILSCWKMNCGWDNMKNCPQTAKVSFLKIEPHKPSFRFLNFEVGSVFRKPISEIFNGFRTSLVVDVVAACKTTNRLVCKSTRPHPVVSIWWLLTHHRGWMSAPLVRERLHLSSSSWQLRIGDRSFWVAGRQLWNNLPVELWQRDISFG